MDPLEIAGMSKNSKIEPVNLNLAQVSSLNHLKNK